ncbi:glycosyltransferase family 4 protein [Patescibacteria group bacterium]|nr:glycosyltransferase family 4 protein [Patescibacteria group bacterium]
MKILILMDKLPPEDKGGAEIVCLNLAWEYQKQGNEVGVITTTRKKESQGNSLDRGVKVHRIYSNYHNRWQPYVSLYNPWVVARVRKILAKEKPDIVHAHVVHKHLSYYSLKIVKEMDIPLVITLHDCLSICYKKFTCFYDIKDLDNSPNINYKVKSLKCWWCQKLRYFPLRNLFVRRFLNTYPDKVITVSQELKKLVEANGIKVSDTIHNGVDADNFKIDDQEIENFKKLFSLSGKKIVLCAGRLNETKGCNQLLAAMRRVGQNLTDVVLLLLAKKDEYSESLVKRAAESGVKIILTGWLNGKDLIAAYHAADLVVTPSICFDTFGMVNIEAMASEKPAITSCFGGGKEIVIDNQSGYIVNPFDVNIFTKRLKALLTDADKAKEMGECGRKIVQEKFLLEYSAQKYLNLFKELTS